LDNSRDESPVEICAPTTNIPVRTIAAMTKATSAPAAQIKAADMPPSP